MNYMNDFISNYKKNQMIDGVKNTIYYARSILPLNLQNPSSWFAIQPILLKYNMPFKKPLYSMPDTYA